MSVSEISAGIAVIDNSSAAFSAITNTVSSCSVAMSNLAGLTAGLGLRIENLNIALIGELNRNCNRTQAIIQNVNESQEELNDNLNRGKDAAAGFFGKIKGAMEGFDIKEKAKQVMNLSDSFAKTTAKLDLLNKGSETTKELQDMIFSAANRSGSSYEASANAVSRLGVNAGEAFKSNKEIVALVEQLNKQFAISAASPEGIEQAMGGVIDTMASGVLSGEAFQSILSEAPSVIQTLSSALGIPVEKLQEIAENGGISAETMKGALLSAAGETNEQFETMEMSFRQMGNMLQNSALKAFSPVLQKVREIANSPEFQTMLSTFMNGLAVAGAAAAEVFDMFVQIGNAAAENFGILAPIILGVAAAVGVYNAMILISKAISAIQTAVEALKTGQLLAQAGAYAAATAAQHGMNAAMAASPVTWITLAIIVLIGVIFALCEWIAKTTGVAESGFGIICGAVGVAAAFIWNTIIGVLNAIIQSAWTTFVKPFIGIIEWILNAVNGGFDSFGGAVANLIGNVISWFLSLGKVVTTIIDAIFGTNWTSGLTNLQNEVTSWGKSEDSITLKREAPVIDARVDYGEAWENSAAWGDKTAESISGFNLKDIFGGTGTEGTEDYLNGIEGIGSGVTKIAENTGTMADSMEISEEDLKYLKDIAEREVIDRTVFSSINVEMGGINNTVNSNMDLDGVVTYLAAALEEQMLISAEGVH